MTNDIDGFDELQDELERLQGEVEKIGKMDGEHVSFETLFPRQFMKKYTSVNSIDKFFEESPWNVESQDEFSEIPPVELDRYVDNYSQFKTWDQMKTTAGNNLIKRRTDF